MPKEFDLMRAAFEDSGNAQIREWYVAQRVGDNYRTASVQKAWRIWQRAWKAARQAHPDVGKMKMPKPCGLFSYGARPNARPTYHHDAFDKKWLVSILDRDVTGGPHRAEFVYSESTIREMLGKPPKKQKGG